jgi:hypothetical protein
LRIRPIPTEEDYHGVALGRNKSQHENVFASTIITFWYSLAQGTFLVQDDLLMFGPNEMIDDMGSRSVSSGIAEPLGAYETFDNRRGRVYTTIAVHSYEPNPMVRFYDSPASMWRQLHLAFVLKIIQNRIKVFIKAQRNCCY